MNNSNEEASAPPRILIARDVALAFADAIAPGEDDERQALIATAMDIGQSLADQGSPGRWDLFRPAEMFKKIAFLDQDQRGGVALRTLGMFQFLALMRLLPSALVVDLSAEILSAAPPLPCLERLHQRFLLGLEKIAAACED